MGTKKRTVNPIMKYIGIATLGTLSLMTLGSAKRTQVLTVHIPNRSHNGKLEHIIYDIDTSYVKAHKNEYFIPKNRIFGGDAKNLTNRLTTNDTIMSDLAHILTSPTYLDNQSNEAKAQRIVDVVYTLPVVPDTNRGEVRHPLNTLMYGGDCEDRARLAVVLLQSLDIPSGLILFTRMNPDTRKSEGHVAIGIQGNFEGFYLQSADAKQYFYAEVGGYKQNNQKKTPKLGPKIGQLPQFLRPYLHIGNVSFYPLTKQQSERKTRIYYKKEK